MSDLDGLKIDKSLKTQPRGSRWASRWIVVGVLLFLVLGAARFANDKWNVVPEVRTERAARQTGVAAGPPPGSVVLNATGYIVAHHKIQLTSKVVGKVAWIGVEKGDLVRRDQVIVRLEDEEYKAQLQQARGNLANLEARLQELTNGSRPEEIAVAKANLEEARADLANAKINLDRSRKLSDAAVLSRQAYDDAKARYDAQAARVASLDKSYELVRIGPRREVIDQVRGQIQQARGQVTFYETQLSNTIIRAPIAGTILERVVEIGEFVTTGFVGDRGAKGYVVSMADLNDLQVELDINQNDFARLYPRQRGVVTTDAYRDRRYDGEIEEMSPEANRQKATVQVKVKILNPDEYLRPEMNASVEFLAKEEAAPKPDAGEARPAVVIPESAVRDGVVFVALDGKAIRRAVKTRPGAPGKLVVESGLIGGEDVIVNPPATLTDGGRIQVMP
ncbi:MAG: efflux RND transporter periplasmic adaptor subunit [Bryobacteraceae bacterium]